MLSERVEFVRDGTLIKGIVYCYMPNGGPESTKPYVKVKRTMPYLVNGAVKHFSTFVVELDDPTFAVTTLDREFGAKMEREYAGKTEDSEPDN